MSLSLSFHLLSEDCLEREGREAVASALEELILELNPMESQGV